MKQIALLLCLVFVTPSLKADLFGGDVAVLTQILAQTIQQLARLNSILKTGKKHKALIEEIHRGMQEVLEAYRTVFPNDEPGIYKEWQNVEEGLQKLEEIYGVIVDHKDKIILKNTDRVVAEAISLNNAIYKYSKQIDEIGEILKKKSNSSSPGLNQKLQVQATVATLHVLNQTLRAQATGQLKLQAQLLALKNRREKEKVQDFRKDREGLQAAMERESKFEIPRFQ